ncbi:MAG TPA: hypothetical protein VNI02_15085 [Blastocatellia bacterium]|jgi:seryl-tRNA synthetase|nr:hypothetical protein [Blastocatellia bacterium]
MITVLFQEPLPIAFKEDLERKVFYISDAIEDFRIIAEGDLMSGIEVRLDERGGPPGDVIDKIHAAAENQRKKKSTPPTECVWSNREGRGGRGDVFSEMVAVNEAFQMGDGLIAVGERFIELFDCLDEALTRVVKADFSGREFRYPTLIQTSVMRRGGYIKYFPQFIMFATRLHSDYDTYQSVMRDEASGTAANYIRNCSDAEFCLPPTMCYHTYHQFSDSTIDSSPGFVVTSKGKSFRFESRYARNLERLWDFTIREVVFVGTGEFVFECRRRFMKEVFGLMTEWELAGHCESANDPFFAEDDSNNSQFIQKLMRLKYELRLGVGGDHTIAAASFNLHNDFIGRSFNMRFADGNFVRTACVGVGLERLTFAFLAQHGLREEDWPAPVRRLLENRRRSGIRAE